MNTELSSTVFNGETKQLMRAGFIFSISMAIITIITFAFAMIAIPISGANAPDGGIQYPYLDTLQQFPRDYIWQFSALPRCISLYVISLISMRDDSSLSFSRSSGNKTACKTVSLFKGKATSSALGSRGCQAMRIAAAT
jgi:hypothetical protein